MPLPMVHLSVARMVTEALGICDSGSFYLGAIAPDAVHMRTGVYQPEWKLASHLRPSREIRKEVVLRLAADFISSHAEVPARDYFAGYGVHIITDILWNQSIFAEFKRQYDADGYPEDRRSAVYYDAVDPLDFELFHRMSWRPEVWNLLADSTGVDTDGLVTAAEGNAWKERTLHWYDSGKSAHTGPVYFFTYEKLTDFIAYAAEDTVRILKGDGE